MNDPRRTSSEVEKQILKGAIKLVLVGILFIMATELALATSYYITQWLML